MSEKPTISVSSTAQPRSNRGQNTGMNTKGLEALIPTKAGSETSAQNSSSFERINFNPGTFSASQYAASEIKILNVENIEESDSGLSQSLLEQVTELGMDPAIVARALKDKPGVIINEVSGSAAIKDQVQITSGIGKRESGEMIAYVVEKLEVRKNHSLEGQSAIILNGNQSIITSSEELQHVEKGISTPLSQSIKGVRLVTRQQPKLEEAPINNQPQFNNKPVSNEQLDQITQLKSEPQPAPAANPFLNPDKVTFTYLSEEEKKAA